MTGNQNVIRLLKSRTGSQKTTQQYYQKSKENESKSNLEFETLPNHQSSMKIK